MTETHLASIEADIERRYGSMSLPLRFAVDRMIEQAIAAKAENAAHGCCDEEQQEDPERWDGLS